MIDTNKRLCSLSVGVLLRLPVVRWTKKYDVEVYQRMEALIGQKLPPYTCDEETVLVLQERVGEAQRMAAREMREADFNRHALLCLLVSFLLMPPVIPTGPLRETATIPCHITGCAFVRSRK